MSSMKGRVLSRGGWPFLTFVCGIGVVIIGIRSRRRGFGALPRIGCRVCWARLVGSSALPAGLGAWRRWWRLTRRVESGIGGFVLGSGGSGGWAPVSLTAFRLGRRLQSSIRSRGADQSVVRCSGGQSSGRPSCSVWRKEARHRSELARACTSHPGGAQVWCELAVVMRPWPVRRRCRWRSWSGSGSRRP